MQFLVQAEHGDQITIDNRDLGAEQQLVHVRLENPLWQDDEIECFSLSIEQARKLARALLAASNLADLIPEIASTTVVARPALELVQGKA